MLNLPPAVHTGVKPKMFKPYVLLTDNPKLHVPGQKQSPSTKNSHPGQKQFLNGELIANPLSMKST